MKTRTVKDKANGLLYALKDSRKWRELPGERGCREFKRRDGLMTATAWTYRQQIEFTREDVAPQPQAHRHVQPEFAEIANGIFVRVGTGRKGKRP